MMCAKHSARALYLHVSLLLSSPIEFIFSCKAPICFSSFLTRFSSVFSSVMGLPFKKMFVIECESSDSNIKRSSTFSRRAGTVVCRICQRTGCISSNLNTRSRSPVAGIFLFGWLCMAVICSVVSVIAVSVLNK